MSEFIYTEAPSDGIVHIPIGLLVHHPQNPRKDLGDLTELAASIKAKGVMQNLTVVPHRDDGGTGCYYVVIGNRRMEASKKAGLTHLPCVISDMTYPEQVQTMLLENMQRVDLTIVEQAEGFQLMMSFGDTVDTIAEKTGFSSATVRRRLELAKLDGKKLREISSRQISIGDLDRLARIEDISKRNELLEKLGTSSFDYSYKDALSRQDERKTEQRWREYLLARGLTEIGYSDAFHGAYVSSGRPYVQGSSVSPQEYVFDEDQELFAFNRGVIYFRRRKNAADNEKAEASRLKAEQKKARIDELRDACRTAYELRRDYVLSVSETDAKRLLPTVISFTVEEKFTNIARLWREEYDRGAFPSLKTGVYGFDRVREEVVDHPYRSLLVHAYLCWCDSENSVTFNYTGEYQKNDKLIRIYDFLDDIGYMISPEERELIYGSHHLYEESEEAR